ncbi:hypothetical protein JW707_05280 [Candidatus Woesearchaeota archaeon]|nr:hypothetical protein [Candidatus Woesearchaeota archaeon]
MAYKVVASRGEIQTRQKGFFRKKEVVAEKGLPNLQEILMLVLNREGMRAMRLDISLEPQTHSYLTTKNVGDIINAVLSYEEQNRQNDRLYIAPDIALASDARAAIWAKAQVDVSGCRNWQDFIKAYEKSQRQGQSKGL